MYILEQLRAMFPNHTLQIMYDIACMLEKHLNVSHAVLYACVYASVKIYRQTKEMTSLITSLLQFLCSMLMDIQLTVRFDTMYTMCAYKPVRIITTYVHIYIHTYKETDDIYIRIKYNDRC